VSLARDGRDEQAQISQPARAGITNVMLGLEAASKADGWQIRTVIARGRVIVEDGRPVGRGRFDQILLDQLGRDVQPSRRLGARSSASASSEPAAASRCERRLRN
jgi:hypothetical protein